MNNVGFRSLALGAIAMTSVVLGGAVGASAGNMSSTDELGNLSGLYVGINGGAGTGTSRYNFDGLGVSSGDFDTSGWLVGGTVGYNFQRGKLLLGVEGDLDWADVSGSTAACATSFHCGVKNNYLGTARGRVGYELLYHIIPYVTGGVAVGDITTNVPGFGSESDTRIGWTAGAGLEFPVTQNISAKVEYLYVDLGHTGCDLSCGSLGTDVEFTENVFRGGVNYRF
jgi:outer membrane immunogenic protein